jgi:site-specific DNA-methyltransferase (adenine-specific)
MSQTKLRNTSTKAAGPNRSAFAARGRRVNGEISCGEATEFLKRLPPNSARVVFLDPPFNLGKQYNSNKKLDQRPAEEYRGWMSNITSEAARILEPGGSLFLYHIPIWAMRLGADLDGKLTFRQWVAVSMKNGFVRGERLYPAHYALVMFSKGSPKKFVRLKISPHECRTCGELIRDYGGYESIIRRKGINLSDIWDDLSPVRHANRKHRLANELPDLLFHRILRMVGSRGSLYVDPFAGSGTGVIAAARRGMRFAANDLVMGNCRLIASRLKEFENSQKKN